MGGPSKTLSRTCQNGNGTAGSDAGLRPNCHPTCSESRGFAVSRGVLVRTERRHARILYGSAPNPSTWPDLPEPTVQPATSRSCTRHLQRFLILWLQDLAHTRRSACTPRRGLHSYKRPRGPCAQTSLTGVNPITDGISLSYVHPAPTRSRFRSSGRDEFAERCSDRGVPTIWLLRTSQIIGANPSRGHGRRILPALPKPRMPTLFIP